MFAKRRHIDFLEAELARKDKIIDSLLNRLMSRDLGQFRALGLDSFLNQPDEPPPARLYDETGLVSVDVATED